MYLPPDLSETVSRAQEDSALKTKLSGCNTPSSHGTLDF